MWVLPLSWSNGQTYGHAIQHVRQVEGYLGQVQRSRSKVKVTRSKKRFKRVSSDKDIVGLQNGRGLCSKKQSVEEEEAIQPAGSLKGTCLFRNNIQYLTPYMIGRVTTRGVFKAYVFFFACKNSYGIKILTSAQCIDALT